MLTKKKKKKKKRPNNLEGQSKKGLTEIILFMH